MGKMILFAGKEIPAGNDIASGATFQGRRVIATSLNVSDDTEQKPESSGNVTQVSWNRGSPLSCRSLALKCENEGGVDEAALIFDEFYFATRFRSVVNNAQILEELIGSYQYLAQELVSRFQRQPNRTFKLAFVHKSNFSLSDGINSASLRASGVELSNPLIAAASQAFKAFAENTAANLAENGNIIPLLVSCEPGNDLSKRDSALSMWLCEYMDAIDALKKPLSPKQKVSWITAGAKKPSGFGILGF